MLAKLIKHEFKATARIFLPILGTVLVLTGAALFWVSDLLILFLYFYRTSHPAVHAANLATYYYGMFLVAISLGF